MVVTDYFALIDAQTWAFIRKTESWYPADTISLNIHGQRDVYNNMCRAFFNGYPNDVQSKDFLADGVDVRCYEKIEATPAAVVLYIHGGGFVVGGLESHDDVCAEICDQTGFRVIAVDYRLAPEHLHPAGFEDCLTAFQWVQKEYDLPIVLVGDSAGGNFAAAVTHASRKGTSNASGVVLSYPSLGGIGDYGSFIDHANAPLLSRADMEFYEDIRTNDADVSGDATYAPLNDTDFSNLPPTVVISAECDPLCDDGKSYCAAIEQAKGQAVWIKEAGLVHGYLRARHTVDRARDSFMRIVTAIDYFGNGIPSSDSDLDALKTVLISIGDVVPE